MKIGTLPWTSGTIDYTEHMVRDAHLNYLFHISSPRGDEANLADFIVESVNKANEGKDVVIANISDTEPQPVDEAVVRLSSVLFVLAAFSAVSCASSLIAWKLGSAWIIHPFAALLWLFLTPFMVWMGLISRGTIKTKKRAGHIEPDTPWPRPPLS